MMNSESWLRAQYQTVVKERDNLQNQLILLERENQLLRNSVYELSHVLSQKSANSLFSFEHPCNWNLSVSPSSKVNQVINDIDDDKRMITSDCELDGHIGSVFCLAFSPGNRYIASGGLDRSVRIWIGSNPYKHLTSLTGHTQLISALKWSETSSKMLLCSIRIWDSERFICVHIIKLPAFGTSVTSCFSDRFDRSFIVGISNSNRISVVDLSINFAPNNSKSASGNVVVPANKVDIPLSNGTFALEHTCAVTSVCSLSSTWDRRDSALFGDVEDEGMGGGAGDMLETCVLVGDELGCLSVYYIDRGQARCTCLLTKPLDLLPSSSSSSTSSSGPADSVKIHGIKVVRSVREVGGGGAESGGDSQKFMSSSSSREHLSTTSSATSGLVPSPVYLVSIQCSNNTIGVFSIDVNILCILLRKHFLKVSYPPHGPVSGTAEGEVGATDNGDSIATDRQRFEEKAEVPQEESSAISANSRAFRPLATLRGHVADDWPVEMSVLRGKDHCFRLYGKVKQSSSHASLHGKSGPGYLVGHEGAGGGAVRSGSSSNLLFAPPSDANPNAAFANINGRDSMEMERDKYFVDGAEDEEDDVANYDIWTGDEGGMAVRPAAQSPPPSSASAAGVMAATACGSRNVSQTTRWNKSLIIATGSLSGEVHLYDISTLDVNGDVALDVSPWTTLDAHQGQKSYGCSFGDTARSTVMASYASDGTIKLWTLDEKQT